MRLLSRRRAAILAAMALTQLPGNAMSANVPPPPLTFRPLPGSRDPGILSIRLFRRDGQAMLAILTRTGNGYTLTQAPMGGPGGAPPAHLRELNSLFGVPSWDVAADAGGFETVWTIPGSAICPLGFARNKSPEIILTQADPRGVFQTPRFTRGENEPGITAVETSERGAALVLFQNPSTGGHPRPRVLPVPAGGILLEGMLLRLSVGYLMLVKLLPPGPRDPERVDLRGESLQPGLLRAIRLGPGLNVSGGEANPLDATPVYEFDADVSGGTVCLVATTAHGHRVATGWYDSGRQSWATVGEAASPAGLISPAVLLSAGTATAAMIEAPPQVGPRIVTEMFPLRSAP